MRSLSVPGSVLRSDVPSKPCRCIEGQGVTYYEQKVSECCVTFHCGYTIIKQIHTGSLGGRDSQPVEWPVYGSGRSLDSPTYWPRRRR